MSNKRKAPECDFEDEEFHKNAILIEIDKIYWDIFEYLKGEAENLLIYETTVSRICYTMDDPYNTTRLFICIQLNDLKNKDYINNILIEKFAEYIPINMRIPFRPFKI